MFCIFMFTYILWWRKKKRRHAISFTKETPLQKTDATFHRGKTHWLCGFHYFEPPKKPPINNAQAKGEIFISRRFIYYPNSK